MLNAYLNSTLKFQFEKNDKFNNITSAMFNAYLISTLKLEKKIFLCNSKNLKKITKINFLKDLKKKDDKFNNITSAMFNAYLI